MNLQSKFGHCMTTQTLNIALCKQDGIMDRQTDGRTDEQTDKQTDKPNTRCPQQTFKAEGIKMLFHTELETDIERAHRGHYFTMTLTCDPIKYIGVFLLLHDLDL